MSIGKPNLYFHSVRGPGIREIGRAGIRGVNTGIGVFEKRLVGDVGELRGVCWSGA